MIDRGIIKWQPFNSCFSAANIIKDINADKRKKRLPTLSEDQLFVIEEKIKDAFDLRQFITLEYFYDGNITVIKGKINSITPQEKKICLNNKYIFFKQIVKIH